MRARPDGSTDADACHADLWIGRPRSRRRSSARHAMCLNQETSLSLGSPFDPARDDPECQSKGQGMMMREASCGSVFVAST